MINFSKELKELNLSEKTEKLYSLFYSKHCTEVPDRKRYELKLDLECFVENYYFSEESKHSFLNRVLETILEKPWISYNDINSIIIDYSFSETNHQLKEFSKLDLLKKFKKLFSEGNYEFEKFLKHPDISEELKHKGLYKVMGEFLECSGIPDYEIFHWMMYNLDLEDIYKKEFAKYDFSEFDAFDTDFFEEACARGAVYQIV